MLPERAVVNAGPLVGLSLAGRLDLLPALFSEFWIPEIVFHEVAVAGLGLLGEDERTKLYKHIDSGIVSTGGLIAWVDHGHRC